MWYYRKFVFLQLSFVFQCLNMLYLFNQKSRIIFFNYCKLYIRSQQISVQVQPKLNKMILKILVKGKFQCREKVLCHKMNRISISQGVEIKNIIHHWLGVRKTWLGPVLINYWETSMDILQRSLVDGGLVRRAGFTTHTSWIGMFATFQRLVVSCRYFSHFESRSIYTRGFC